MLLEALTAAIKLVLVELRPHPNPQSTSEIVLFVKIQLKSLVE
jgi:hypothetical protein